MNVCLFGFLFFFNMHIIIVNILYLYLCWQSSYFGPMVFGSDILQESKQLKLIDDQKKLYNLRNDDLFGKPLNTKWEKIEK